MYGIKTVVQMQHTVQNFLWAFIWDEKCVILLILWMGTTVNSYCCVEIQRSLKAHVCRVHLTKCLQYYSSMIMQGHTSMYHRGHCKFWMDSDATSTIQFWPYNISLSPVCHFHKGPVRTSLCLDEALHGPLFSSLTNSDISVFLCLWLTSFIMY